MIRIACCMIFVAICFLVLPHGIFLSSAIATAPEGDTSTSDDTTPIFKKILERSHLAGGTSSDYSSGPAADPWLTSGKESGRFSAIDSDRNREFDQGRTYLLN